LSTTKYVSITTIKPLAIQFHFIVTILSQGIA